MAQNGVVPEKYADLLGTKALVHVATLGPNGEPQNNPVWFDWDGKFVKISQTKTRQKFKNVSRDARVALSIVDPENPYRYLELRGSVERVEEDSENDFINAMAKKYLDRDVYPFHQPGDERVVLFIRPEHATYMGG
ncbi:PPOX class probable F420-dependent enzyme [Rubrobacter radiotolerans]|uniref:PPOX class F420-dependent oxidoreductase n=1 Tax=Rubrobacter radiotolerans TaxID=42256 RepID=A0A023X1E6_RUBRA|nr:PPOX class F420-dependent oxidoreductase [Rubrobacter radiotolerans]AHY46297.1 PPOX class probable F420-dependent enzyme [Rubrobacter radiotolerans]MDX5893703.1 PPOX class F420-dependent oxidoreductase [Rubrobacter radiotolerans]SMC04312.1 hypothetical protein SAMN00767673_1009 [Rubrobacter radiotolerans DSM 5868]